MWNIQILPFIMLAWGTLNSQPDTVVLKKLVPTGNEIYKHKEFWNYIHTRDQEMRKHPSIVTMDEENLILVCYYFNKFGYPDVRSIGKKANAIDYVWGHNRYFEIDKLTAPIIIESFNNNVISENYFRTYYLRKLYQRYFDDSGYMTKPLDLLYTDLNIQPSTKIPINQILEKLAEYRNIKNDSIHTIGTWITPESTNTYEVGGKILTSNIKSQQLTMYLNSNGKTYLRFVASDDSYDPIEMELISEIERIYKEKAKTTLVYYKISDTGDLIYIDPKNQISREYKISKPE